VRLELDIARRTFRGDAVLGLAGPGPSRLVLDAADLTIERVACNGVPVEFVAHNEKLSVDLPAADRSRLEIRYAGASSEGLRIHDDHAFTGFDTRRWLPCDFSPGSRAPIRIAVASSRDWIGVGSGATDLGRVKASDVARFSLTTPHPAYLFGFAVGDFWRASSRAGATEFALLATRRSPRDAAQCLAAVERAAEFFHRASGIAYPFESFTLVLARGTKGQEKAAFALLDEDWIWEWLGDAREDWLPIHELAHSWWGNLVTCASWSHFWLNEAFATAMTAFYKEHRWGASEYERERALARRRVDRALRRGRGRALELPPGATFAQASGGWSYAYGFELVNELRARLGDERFFRALKTYVGDHPLAGVTGDDFLEAFAGDDSSFRAELGQRIRRPPPAPGPEPPLERLAEEANARDGVRRFLAVDGLTERCLDQGQDCSRFLGALAARENDTNRAVAASARRLRRAWRAEFWKTRRRGANLFDLREDFDRLLAARDAGVEFVRLAPNKYQTPSRDFLLGDAGSYRGIPGPDAKELVRVLDAASKAQMKVLLTTLSLPGARWRQHNSGKDDLRLWDTASFQPLAAGFWRDLVDLVGGHDALVGYDLLNEPRPEALARIFDASDPRRADWAKRNRDTLADVNHFYRRAIAAIRSADPVTPVVLESSLDAAASSFPHLEPVTDQNVLYSFHLYDPWLYTSHENAGKWSYPGRIPVDAAPGSPTEEWGALRLAQTVAPVVAWTKRHALPPERVLVGELGCFRRAPGAAAWLEDAVALVEARGWHWAFYSFREDEWDGMDYELGPSGRARRDNPLWNVLSRRLNRKR